MVNKHLSIFLQGTLNVDVPMDSIIRVVGLVPTLADKVRVMSFPVKSFKELYEAVDSVLPTSDHCKNFVILIIEQTVHEISVNIDTYKGLVYSEHLNRQVEKFVLDVENKLQQIAEARHADLIYWTFEHDLTISAEFTDEHKINTHIKTFQQMEL